MAYHCLHTNSFTGYTEALSFISTSLQTIGWTLHDDISSTDKVFTSTGEDNIFVNAYIRIFISTYLRFEGYMWWNSDTNTGTGKAYTSVSYNYVKPKDNSSLIVYGNKDVIMIWSAVDVGEAGYNSMAFGYLNPFIEGYATTASGISSGSNILINVDSTSNLINDSYAKIIGTETEGRDTVYITGIENETQFRVTSTPRDYVSGAKIGIHPCTFFVTSATCSIQYVDLKYVCGYLSSSTSNASTSHEYQNVGQLFSTNSRIDPEVYTNRYIIQPQGFGDSSPYPMVGVMKEFKTSPVSRTVDIGYDTYLYCAGENPVNSSPTVSTVSGIIDSGQSWEVDEFVDKIVVITSGPGTGQTRNILSNTSDILNIGDLWDNVPTVDSTYEIHEIVYRNLYSYACAREIVS